MRLTVGPLPSAVYWRRRAVVLGALFLFLMVLAYSCSGPGRSGEKTGASGSSSPNAPTPTGPALLTPETGAPPGSEEAVPPAESADPPGESQPAPEPAAPGVPVGDACTDAEISVTPVASQNAPKVGVTIELRLKIKNLANRTCSRDVGADLQEIYIKLAAQPVWSSDKCGVLKGSRVEAFAPGFEREYQVSWNGRDSSRCANGTAAGPYPQPGEYQLFGRVGSKVSDPVKLTIKA
ncbi:hypothetical protein [Micromonospora sp. NPDC049679]|uniref:hypothetical protein n=1 Tax=Micromonospora sp. NPDC049679 TaxID=3155920 RepID=UPI0033DCC1DA